jgi:hypothetical protein
MAAVAVAAALELQKGVRHTSPAASLHTLVQGCAATFACAGVLL